MSRTADRLIPAPEPREPSAAALPDRYSVRQDQQGRHLTCLEAPTVIVRIERGFAVSAAAARKYPSGSIFLDGAAQGEPFLDPERGIYNLDHHEGCVRAFTLAACEQALVLVRKGLDLRERDWTLFANEPDLDTVLAIWLLLNHMRINDENPEIRQAITPVVRLEGVLDTHGPELADLCGLGEELLRVAGAQIDYLRARELELKRRGEWEEIDPVDYAAELLRKIDGLIYSSLHFAGFKEVEVLARAQLAGSRSVVVCRSELGIYEVEQHLRTLHGSRLGVIALQKNPSSYTLRQVDSFLPVNLERAYETLNLLDPGAGVARSGNRWGGSGEIGGSPRSSGTRLSPEQIAEAVQIAYRKSTPLQTLLRVGQALALSGIVLAGALLARIDWLPTQKLANQLAAPLGSPELGYAILAATFSAALLLVFGRRYPRLYGLRAPAGRDWWLLLPLAALGALAGGVWVTGSVAGGAAFAGRRAISSALILLTAPLAAELLFRGLVHGLLAQSFRIQVEGGRWFLSRPVFLSALFYALGTGAVGLELLAGRPAMWPFPLLVAGAFVFGAASGTARERSGSLIPPILFHWIGGALVTVLQSF